MTLKKAIEYKVPAFKPITRRLTYNEQCAATGDRSYDLGKKPEIPAPDPK